MAGLASFDVSTGAGRLDLARREADVALRYVRPEGGELVSRRVARVAHTAYASRGYLASHPRPVRGSGLSGHDIVALEERIQASGATEMAGEQLRDARVVLRASNSLTLLEAVELGLGQTGQGGPEGSDEAGGRHRDHARKTPRGGVNPCLGGQSP